MCFSASASFIAGGVLGGIGIVAITKAKIPAHRVFAVIPFIFCVQQFAEGFLWLSLTKEPYAAWKTPSMYIFLFFAQVLWPMWVPFSIMLLEDNPTRKRILKYLSVVGVMLSAMLCYFLFHYPVDANAMGAHIMYSIGSPVSMHFITAVFYFSTAVLPPFLSTVKKVWWFGVALIVSWLIAKIFYADYIPSIWCYFAALISGAVVFIIWESSNEESRSKLSAEIRKG